jgi:hypothetical protein
MIPPFSFPFFFVSIREFAHWTCMDYLSTVLVLLGHHHHTIHTVWSGENSVSDRNLLCMLPFYCYLLDRQRLRRVFHMSEKLQIRYVTYTLSFSLLFCFSF